MHLSIKIFVLNQQVYQNLTSCQLLGNLCVMLDYSREFEAETSACFHYLELQKLLDDFGDITGWYVFFYMKK